MSGKSEVFPRANFRKNRNDVVYQETGRKRRESRLKRLGSDHVGAEPGGKGGFIEGPGGEAEDGLGGGCLGGGEVVAV